MLQFELTPDQSHVHLYLMTARSMTPIGVCQESPESISRYTGLTIQEVDKALDSLVTRELIYRWEGNWIFAVYRFLSETPRYANQNIGYELILTSCPDYIQRIVLSYHPQIKVNAQMIRESQMKKHISEHIARDLGDDNWQPDPENGFYTPGDSKKPRNPHRN